MPERHLPSKGRTVYPTVRPDVRPYRQVRLALHGSLSSHAARAVSLAILFALIVLDVGWHAWGTFVALEVVKPVLLGLTRRRFYEEDHPGDP